MNDVIDNLRQRLNFTVPGAKCNEHGNYILHVFDVPYARVEEVKMLLAQYMPMGYTVAINGVRLEDNWCSAYYAAHTSEHCATCGHSKKVHHGGINDDQCVTCRARSGHVCKFTTSDEPAVCICGHSYASHWQDGWCSARKCKCACNAYRSVTLYPKARVDYPQRNPQFPNAAIEPIEYVVDNGWPWRDKKAMPEVSVVDGFIWLADQMGWPYKVTQPWESESGRRAIEMSYPIEGRH